MGFDRSVQTLAFRRHVLDVLARSDGRVERTEQAVVDELCSDADLTAAGLADEYGALLPSFDHAREQALSELPHAPLADRFELLSSFLRLCLADGHLDRSEGSLLVAVAELLDVSASAFDDFLSSQDDVGDVDLDEPLDE